MTVRKGVDWGDRVDRPSALVVAASDAELAALVDDRSGAALAVAAGDLRRTLGDGGGGPTVQRVPIDLLRIDADGVEMCAVAHVVARRSWWRGRIVGVFNCEHLGRWDVAPRGHPNDGLADVLDVDAAMTMRERLQAWRRLPSGTHVPHPSIATARRPAASWDFERPVELHVDGVRVGTVRRLAVTVEPDAFHLHV
jgi:hypothetical protein